MSVGGPTLGTLLVQRIDAALGIATSQQTNIANGARPDAVSQAAEAAKLEQLQNPVVREPRESVERAQIQNDQQARQSIERTKLDAQKGLLAGSREGPNTGTTPSAPTTLGNAARTILSLLMSFPEQPAPVQSKQPLVSPFSEGRPNPTGQTATGAANASAGPGANTGPNANAGPNATATPAAPNQAGASSQGGPAAGTPNNIAATTNTQGNAVISMAKTAQLTSPQAFAQALGNALQSSGLFYESHLADLAFGKTQANTVRQEPQAQLHQPSPLRGGTLQTTADAAPAQNASTPSRAEPTTITNTPTGSGQTTTPGSATQPAASTALAGLHPETHLMVRQQLEVLANQTIAWRGEAWPDAKMDWEIQRREPDHDAGPDAQTHWATRVKLQLPHLGEIDVRINLVDNRVLLHAVAPQSAHTLSEHRDLLRSSFDASGLTLSQFVVDSSTIEKDSND